jgi:hypothetical protein
MLQGPADLRCTQGWYLFPAPTRQPVWTYSKRLGETAMVPLAVKYPPTMGQDGEGLCYFGDFYTEYVVLQPTISYG